MTATSMSRMVVPFMAFVAACGMALVLAIQHVRREPPVDTKAATAAPAVSKPASGARDQGPAALAAAQAKADALAAARAASPVTPDKPTVVLSQPAAPKPAAGAVVVEAVEIEPGGKFHVSGRAGSGAAVRLYLNDSFIAPVTAGADGRFAITINEGVAPGSYRVRLDEVESNSGAVRARAEVPFSVPDTVVTGPVPAPPTPSTRPAIAPPQQPPLHPPAPAL